MKTKNLTIAFLMISPLGILIADDVPKPFVFARYQAMMDRSPFAVATAVAAPAATPNFAKDLYVANAAHSKDGDYVTIASSADKSFKRYLSTNAAEDGYAIANIEWSEKVGETKVTITKDGQTATLAFNEALLKQATSNPQQAMMQPPNDQITRINPIVPSPMVQQPNFQQRPAPIPQLPTPPPRVRGVIPRNPNLVNPNQPTVATTPETQL
jgi:hypothetical protein